MKTEGLLKVAILGMGMCAAHAQTVETPSALKDQGCLACHHESKARVGPSFASIAEKRCTDPGAALARFTSRIRDGAGHPKAMLSEDQLSQLVRWICGLKRD